MLGLSAQSLAAKNRNSLAARKSLFDRDFASGPSTTSRGGDATATGMALLFDDNNSRTGESFPETVSQSGSELDDDPAIVEQRRVEYSMARVM